MCSARVSLPDCVRCDFGRVDILVNNAGIVVGKPFLEVPDALAEKVMQVNTIGTSTPWVGPHHG